MVIIIIAIIVDHHHHHHDFWLQERQALPHVLLFPHLQCPNRCPEPVSVQLPKDDQPHRYATQPPAVQFGPYVVLAVCPQTYRESPRGFHHHYGSPWRMHVCHCGCTCQHRT